MKWINSGDHHNATLAIVLNTYGVTYRGCLQLRLQPCVMIFIASELCNFQGTVINLHVLQVFVKGKGHWHCLDLLLANESNRLGRGFLDLWFSSLISFESEGSLTRSRLSNCDLRVITFMPTSLRTSSSIVIRWCIYCSRVCEAQPNIIKQ